jgi:hypothetical protein
VTTPSQTSEAERAVRAALKVDTSLWEPDPEHQGCSRRVRSKTVGEVFAQIRAIVGREPAGAEEYFMICTSVSPGMPWPGPDRRTVVYPVTGGSEGHYVHVAAGDQTLILGKTFAGWDAAWDFAKFLAEILAV